MTTPTPRTDVCLITCPVCGSESATSNEATINKELFGLRRELAAAQEALYTANLDANLAVERAQAAEERAEEYRKDAERLDSVASEYFKIEPFGMSTWAGDADVGWCITKFYMAKPCERVVAEVFRDDPRAAIDAAMKEPK